MSVINFSGKEWLALNRVINAYNKGRSGGEIIDIELGVDDEYDEDGSVFLVLHNSICIQSHPDQENVEYLVFDVENTIKGKPSEFKFNNYQEALIKWEEIDKQEKGLDEEP